MDCCKLHIVLVFSFYNLLYNGEAARILSFSLVPSQSHSIVFKTIHEELLKRGHELVVVTVDPIYKNGLVPENLTEIDVHNVSYSYVRQQAVTLFNRKNDPIHSIKAYFEIIASLFEKQVQTREVQRLLKENSREFDLLFLDASHRISTVFAHIFQAPAIFISTLGAVDRRNHVFGVPTHPIQYPQCSRHRLYDLTMWEKIKELYTDYRFYTLTKENEVNENRILKHLFGPETPTITDLDNYGDMLFHGDGPFWEDNRPMPPSVIYIGGINKIPEKPLPKEIKSYLDSSTREVIYVSFGTFLNTVDLPPRIIEVLTKVFSILPYNVCWKWDSDNFPANSENIRRFKWLPQADFLRHPKVKLFITHGGLRSTEDAIEAGVPLIGIPIFMDQFFNSEKYVRHGIGLRLDKESLTEDQLTTAINMIMTNKSYTQNVIKLRTIINDQPMTPLERAVWWTEHVLRHGGARHLRAPTANMKWAEYFELELVVTALVAVFTVFVLVVFCVRMAAKMILKRNKPKRKIF